jgi:GntR family transcriptional regulator
VRDVARSVRLNPNTISRAWRELELVGMLEARRGSGMFVAAGAVALARAFRTRELTERLGRAVGDALASGLDAPEIIELVQDACRAWPLHDPHPKDRDGPKPQPEPEPARSRKGDRP